VTVKSKRACELWEELEEKEEVAKATSIIKAHRQLQKLLANMEEQYNGILKRKD
jgi:hypothetical protein